MTTSVNEIIRLTKELISDPELERIHTHDWIDWINDGQRVICLVRPDACSATQVISLTTNTTKQTLPTNARRLIGVTRNMGAGGLTIGKAIRGPVPRETLDSFNPDWPTVTGSYIKEYLYNPERPKEFHVIPQVTTAHYIEVETANNPTDVVDHDSTIDIDDVYSPALVTWCAYRVFSKDTEESPNYIRAEGFSRQFFNLMGIKTNADMKILPQLTEFGKTIK